LSFCSINTQFPELDAFPTRRSSDLEARVPAHVGAAEHLLEPHVSLVVAQRRYRAGDVVAHERGRLEFGDLLGHAEQQRVYHADRDRKSTRLNSSHVKITYAVFCLKK